MSKLVPKLRFKEFSGEWEENEVVIKIVSGNNYPLDSYVKKGTLLIQGLNINPHKLTLENPIYISNNFLTDRDIFIQKNDILIGLNRPIIDNKLKICLYNKDDQAVLYQRAGVLKFNKEKLSNLFLYYYLSSNTFLRQLFLELVGSDQPYIKSDLFKKTKNIFPKETQEQQKIANTLSSLDSLIEAQQRKVEALKKHKKGLMQQLFPAEGANVPKLRFKEFRGEWEEKTIDDIANRYDNLRVPITASDRINGATPYYGANGIQSYVEGYTHDGEFVLLAEDGANDLKNYPIHYVNGKIWVNNHAHVLQAKEGISNNLFLSYAIQNINFEPYLVGGGRAKLNANVMMKIIFLIPTPKEQQKIANTLSSLDNLIEAYQRKVEALKKHKKGLMQQMFVNGDG